MTGVATQAPIFAIDTTQAAPFFANVQGAMRLVFHAFRQTGKAYAVVHRFTQQGMGFRKRANGGIWDGKLIWGRLSHARVLGILKNPSYTGAYVHGRYQTIKEISPLGDCFGRSRSLTMSATLRASWRPSRGVWGVRDRQLTRLTRL